MKGIIDGIKYLNGEIKDLDGKIEKGEDLRQELGARRYLNLMETRRYNPKFHKDIVNNLKRELDEIDLQILTNEGQLLTHQKERGEHTWHLKELKQRWRKQSAQDTPANTPQAEPNTPAGATANPTPEANQRPQGKNKRKINKLSYTFDGKDRIELSFNHKPVMLTEQETKLFKCLNEDRRTPDEIIGYIWNGYARKDLRMKRKNVKELRGRLNKKCSKIGVDALISKLTNDYYALDDSLEVVER